MRPVGAVGGRRGPRRGGVGSHRRCGRGGGGDHGGSGIRPQRANGEVPLIRPRARPEGQHERHGPRSTHRQ